MKKGLRITRRAEDENTKKYILEDDNLRTTADVGGEELVRRLEFISIDKVEEKGELAEFVEVLKLLEKRGDIKKVNIIIGELSEGKRGKKFARLSDGVTKRKYAIGQITMMDGRECSLIDVERENRALSMLILKAEDKVNWEQIYSELLIGLVEASGKWSNEIIKTIEKKDIIVHRKNHISNCINESKEQFYKALM